MIRLKNPLVTAALVLAIAMLAAWNPGGDDNKDSGSKANVPANITVGSDIPYPPFEFGKPTYQGFDIDVATRSRRAGHHGEHSTRPRSTRSSGTSAQGKFDMVISATTITTERAGNRRFLRALLPSGAVAGRHQGQLDQENDRTDLEGRSIGAQRAPRARNTRRRRSKTKDRADLRPQVDDAITGPQGGHDRGGRSIDRPVVEVRGEGAQGPLRRAGRSRRTSCTASRSAKGSDDLRDRRQRATREAQGRRRAARRSPKKWFGGRALRACTRRQL